MIDNLTNGMIRLSEEISALRHNRVALTCDLVLGRVNLGNTVSEMIAGFQRDRQEMGEKTKAELDESRANREHTISEMIAGFQRDREEMGDKTKFEVSECVSNVKDAVAGMRLNVAGLRAEFAGDIKGAHAAWSGPAAKETQAGSDPEKQSRESHSKSKKKKR